MEENQLTPKAKANLMGATPWMKLVSILGLISAAFIALSALFMLTGGSVLSDTPLVGSGFLIFMAFLYVVMAAAIGYVYSLLLRAANKFKQFSNGDSKALTDGLGLQKQFWTIVGILMLIMIVLSVLATIFMIVAFMTVANRHGSF